MSEQTDKTAERSDGSPRPAENKKKPFVEPVVSSPIDVLEATTFFQAVATGEL